MIFNNKTPEQVSLIRAAVRGDVSRRSFLTQAALVGLTAATAGTVLSACTPGTNGGTGGTGTGGYKPGSAQLKVNLGAELPGVPYRPGYKGPKARRQEKFGDGKTEFTVLVRAAEGMDWDTHIYNKWLEDATGVKIKYIPIPKGTEGAPKLNAIISSGDLPDAFMAGPGYMGGFTPSEISVYGQQGLFQPLDQLIDEYAPNLLDTMSQIPGLRKEFASPDGTMYSFPSINDCYHCKSYATRTWINQTWLNKVGKPMPQNLDDFKAVMQAFKNQNPSGQPFAMPFSGQKADTFIWFFMQSFGYVPQTWLGQENGKLFFSPVSDAFREGMIWTSEMFAAGLFDKRIFSQTADDLKRLVDDQAGPAVGAMQAGAHGAFTKTKLTDANSPIHQYVPLQPLEGPGGRKPVVSWSYYGRGTPNALMLSSKCKDPATLIRWADFQMDLQVTLTQQRGRLDHEWRWCRVGEKGIDGEQGLYTRMPAESGALEGMKARWDEWGPYNFAADVRLGESSPNSIEPLLLAAGKLYEPFKVDQGKTLPALAYGSDDAAAIGELKTNLTNHIQASIAIFCTGGANPADDNAWNEYVKKCGSIGLTQYLDISQKALDLIK